MSLKSSRDRLSDALQRIADPQGEGARACLTVYEGSAQTAAEAADIRQREGRSLGPLDGIIVSIKDLFDVRGEVTRAGSKVLAEEGAPAAADAVAVQRLRAAGTVIVAKTNMSEFAFSGVGTNPHYGTPGNPADRARVPGGSTSGGAVAVADGMCAIAIGTDTGGSTRIPAALCGIVGWKPSRQRVPTDGAFPLSYTLDSIGPMARTVADCALADAVMAGELPRALQPADLTGLRFAVAQGFPLDGMDGTVSSAWSDALARLAKARAHLSDETFPQFEQMVAVNAMGGFAPPEAFSIHRDLLNRRGADIDQNIRARIERGGTMSAADYIAMSQARLKLVRAMRQKLESFDVMVLPTTPIVAPKIADVGTPDSFGRNNMMLLRNTSMVNFFDGCAVSLPMPVRDGLHTGLMLVGLNGDDSKLLNIAASVEKLLAA